MGEGLMSINAKHHQGAVLVLLSSLRAGQILNTQDQTNFLSDKEETGQHVSPGGEASLCCCGQDRVEVQLLRVGQLEVKLCSGQRQRQNFPGEEKLHMRT